MPLDPPPQGVLELFATPPGEIAELARPSNIPGLDHCARKPRWPRWNGAAPASPASAWPCNRHWPATGSATTTSCSIAPPTLGLLMINALAAANRLIIPTQAEPLALHGLEGMVRTGEMVERSRQRPLPISILPTLFDRRTRTGNETLRQMQAQYGSRVWEDAIPVDTRISSPTTLTAPIQDGYGYPGRGLAAYRHALEWLRAEDAAQLEKAA